MRITPESFQKLIERVNVALCVLIIIVPNTVLLIRDGEVNGHLLLITIGIAIIGWIGRRLIPF